MRDLVGQDHNPLAARVGRWYGSQTQTAKIVLTVAAFALIAAVLWVIGNAMGDAIGGIILLVFAFVAYFFPAFVADRRDVPNKGSVRVINLFFGWTLIGWVIALAMAMAGESKAGPGGTTSRTRGGTTAVVSDTRACPFCAEDIRNAAIVCKHCGRDVPSDH